MNAILWICQGLLALLFLSAGITKWKNPEKFMQGNDKLPLAFLRFIGTSEILGSIGVTFPWLLNILPVLTPLAAIGLSIIMLFAVFIHLRKKEYGKSAFTATVLIICLFVAISRFNQLPV